MKYYVYITQNIKGKYYVGQTNNLSRRLNEHKIGRRCNYTRRKFKGIFLLKYFEIYNTRFKAEEREAQLKKWTRYKKEALINKNLK